MTPSRTCSAVLFDANGTDRACIALSDVDIERLASTQVLWVDCQDMAAFDDIRARLAIPQSLADAARAPGDRPAVFNTTQHFWIRVSSLSVDPGAEIQDHVLDLVAGRNVVITIRRSTSPEATELMPVSHCDTAPGRLDVASFVAAILHRLLTTYFDAVAEIEDQVERIDQAILDPKHVDCTDELRTLLRATARIRRRLARHRTVFSTLARPDFSPADEGDRRKHFATLDDKYERAMDLVEDSRDLVVDCFELFSSRTALDTNRTALDTNRTALDTNRTMRKLTVLTVLIGAMAVTTGVFGMNFDVGFFSSETGFWITIVAMTVFSIGAWLIASLKRWA